MNVMKITPWSALRICWEEQNAGGDWPEMLLLAGIICSVASGIRPAQPCALPILPNSLFQTCGINPSANASCGHRALFPKRLVQELFDGSPPAMEIREPSSDRFHFFFQDKIENSNIILKALCLQAATLPPPSLLSVSVLPVISIIMGQREQCRHSASSHCCLMLPWALDVCTCWGDN